MLKGKRRVLSGDPRMILLNVKEKVVRAALHQQFGPEEFRSASRERELKGEDKVRISKVLGWFRVTYLLGLSSSILIRYLVVC